MRAGWLNIAAAAIACAVAVTLAWVLRSQDDPAYIRGILLALVLVWYLPALPKLIKGIREDLAPLAEPEIGPPSTWFAVASLGAAALAAIVVPLSGSTWPGWIVGGAFAVAAAVHAHRLPTQPVAVPRPATGPLPTTDVASPREQPPGK